MTRTPVCFSDLGGHGLPKVLYGKEDVEALVVGLLLLLLSKVYSLLHARGQPSFVLLFESSNGISHTRRAPVTCVLFCQDSQSSCVMAFILHFAIFMHPTYSQRKRRIHERAGIVYRYIMSLVPTRKERKEKKRKEYPSRP